MKSRYAKLLLLITFSLVIIGNTLYAQSEPTSFAIIPEIKVDDLPKTEEYIKQVWQTGGSVMETYQRLASGNTLTLGEKLATGIMDRTTLLDYIVYLIRFLGQIGLVIGALMIIYAGYLYSASIFFSGDGVNKWKEAVKWAVIGVLVIAFAYAIIKTFTALFLGT